MTNPLDRFRTASSRTEASGERLSVLVALRAGDLDEESRARLESLGLSIEREIQNKVIGSIPAARLTDLRRDPLVAQVDVSARLRPHE